MTLGPRPVVTEDRLLDGRVRLLQSARGYRVAIDPVVLAAAVPARAGEAVLDLGCGSGAAALCLLARVSGVTATGLECDPAAAALARDNAAANGVADSYRILEGELLAPPPALRAARFDHVLLNPPYLDPARARLPEDADRRRSHGEAAAGLADWLDLSLRRLRDDGTLSVIHRAERLDEILAALAGRAGGIVIFPLWPGGAEAKPAKRIVVARPQGQPGLSEPASRPGAAPPRRRLHRGGRSGPARCRATAHLGTQLPVGAWQPGRQSLSRRTWILPASSIAAPSVACPSRRRSSP